MKRESKSHSFFKYLPVFLLLLSAHAASAAELTRVPVADIDEVEGTVQFLRGGELLPAKQGIRLQQGDEIRTPKDGRVTLQLLSDRTFITVNFNSVLLFKTGSQNETRVEAADGLFWVRKNTSKRKFTLFLTNAQIVSGKAEYFVRTGAKPKVAVQSGKVAVIGEKGKIRAGAMSEVTVGKKEPSVRGLSDTQIKLQWFKEFA